jgi:hypothetical protein
MKNKVIDDKYMDNHRKGCSVIAILITLIFIGICIYNTLTWPFLITVAMLDLIWFLYPLFTKGTKK